jgi:prolyl-tRNA synthetase
MMKDGKALQSGTSHFLGQNFAKAFDIKFVDETNEIRFAWTTSWGLSTRMVGAIVMTHGDDQGLILPPRLAPIQAVIVPIWRKDAERSSVMEVSARIAQQLGESLRVKLDTREEVSPGFKFNDWEMRGVPLRIEIGPRDVANNQVMLARRDMPGREGKTQASMDNLVVSVQQILATIQQAMLQNARDFRDRHTVDVTTYEELAAAVETGFARAWWAGTSEDELRLKNETKATIRCIPLEQPGGRGKCVLTGKEACEMAIFGKAY